MVANCGCGDSGTVVMAISVVVEVMVMAVVVIRGGSGHGQGFRCQNVYQSYNLYSASSRILLRGAPMQGLIIEKSLQSIGSRRKTSEYEEIGEGEMASHYGSCCGGDSALGDAIGQVVAVVI